MISTLFLFSLAFSISLSLSWLVYKWTVSNSGMTFRRRLMLIVMTLSFTIATLPFVFPYAETTHIETILQSGNEIVDIHPTIDNNDNNIVSSFDWTQIFTIFSWIYITGVILMLLYHLCGLGFMVWLRLTSKQIYVAGGFEVWQHRYHSFSSCCLGNWIFIPPTDCTEEEIHMICIHEHAHMIRSHWVETVLAQLILAFDWYNPAAWSACATLRDIHEYEADKDVLASGINPYDYQMMLIKKAVGYRFHSLTNSLNHSSLKKRITMMQKTKSSARGAWMRSLALVPAFTLAILAVQSPVFATTRTSVPPATSVSKVTENSPAVETNDSVYETYDVPPSFVGGEPEMYRFLAQKLSYPAEAVKNNTQGTVLVSFIVNKDGSVSNVGVEKGVSPEIDAEAIRVVKLMPKFNPGKMGGKPVNVAFRIPIRFQIPKKSKK